MCVGTALTFFCKCTNRSCSLPYGHPAELYPVIGAYSYCDEYKATNTYKRLKNTPVHDQVPNCNKLEWKPDGDLRMFYVKEDFCGPCRANNCQSHCQKGVEDRFWGDASPISIQHPPGVADKKHRAHLRPRRTAPPQPRVCSLNDLRIEISSGAPSSSASTTIGFTDASEHTLRRRDSNATIRPSAIRDEYIDDIRQKLEEIDDWLGVNPGSSC